jgi:hypothetical protein
VTTGTIREIYRELAAELRGLIASTPPADAPLTQKADHECRKAEFYDRLAVVEPAWTAAARQAAGIARMNARRLIRERRLGFGR